MSSSPQDSDGKRTLLPNWILHVWIKIRSTFLFLFFGRGIYVQWLKADDSEIARAQRLRSRAPSWLRDHPNKIKTTLQEYQLEDERLNQTKEPISVYSEHPAPHQPSSQRHENDANHTMMVNPLPLQNDHADPKTQFGLRPAERPASTPSPQSKHTQLYLGPVGEDRADEKQVVIETKRKRPVDLPLVLIISFLMTIGLVMVYSSSIVKAGMPRNNIPGDPAFFFKNQAFFMGLGIFVMYVVSKVPYQVWGLTSVYAYLIGVIGLILVFSPMGKTVNGAHRWIKLGVNIQPIEFVKFAWILLLCLWFGDRQQDMSLKRMFIIPAIPFIVLVILLGFQPDFGSMIIITVIFGVTYLIAGGSLTKLLPYAIPVGAGAVLLMASKFHHITDRINNYIRTFTHPGDIEYNLRQALISFCSGRFTGVGLGQSSQKEYFLPEAHTDFILSITGAEFGFLGVFLLASLYVAFLLRCIYIARRAHDLFGALVVTMFSLILSMQAFINMAMAIGLLPTKGLTLPLISYGGSSLLITCLSLGVILNISRGAYPSKNGLTLILLLSRFNPLPKFIRWLDQKFDKRKKDKRLSQLSS
jgi:cell division protein FtsW